MINKEAENGKTKSIIIMVAISIIGGFIAFEIRCYSILVEGFLGLSVFYLLYCLLNPRGRFSREGFNFPPNLYPRGISDVVFTLLVSMMSLLAGIQTVQLAKWLIDIAKNGF